MGDDMGLVSTLSDIMSLEGEGYAEDRPDAGTPPDTKVEEAGPASTGKEEPA
jgi:hypothetical protein